MTLPDRPELLTAPAGLAHLGRRSLLGWALAASGSAFAADLNRRSAAARASRTAAPPAAIDPFVPPAADLPPTALESRLNGIVRTGLQRAGLPMECLGIAVRPIDPQQAHAWRLRADQPFVMASATKLVTSMAALDLVGPGFRWRTQFLLDGPLIDGQLHGNLRILGGGDARLTSEELRQAFRRLRERGLRGIEGHIVLDRQAFLLSDDDFAGTPVPSAQRPEHQRPDAFVIDESVVGVMLGQEPGDPLRAEVWPPLAGVRLGADDWATGVRCEAQLDLRPLPAESLGVGRADWRVSLQGRWSPACGPKRLAAASMPHDWFGARAVAAAWLMTGGQLGGRVIEQPFNPFVPVASLPLPAPDKAFALVESPRLAQWLGDMNKHSHNLLSRHLMLSLAPGFPRRAATLDGARQRVQTWLTRQGLPKGAVTVDNGSGLSRAERASPDALVHLLQRAWTRPWRDLFVKSLPIAGVDGTLAGRFKSGAATGHAYLKTGSLLDARALAGYLEARSGTTHAVALFVNHPQAAHAVPLMDALIERLVDEL